MCMNGKTRVMACYLSVSIVVAAVAEDDKTAVGLRPRVEEKGSGGEEEGYWV